jgi:hypothetical protein
MITIIKIGLVIFKKKSSNKNYFFIIAMNNLNEANFQTKYFSSLYLGVLSL